MTIYSLEVLLSQCETSLSFHVWFWKLLLDLHTNRFHRRQLRRSGYSHILKSFQQFVVINTVKLISVFSVAEDIFLEFSCFLYDEMGVDNLISGSSAFAKSSLYIWNFLTHILLKFCLKGFEHYLASMWNECNFNVVWTFFGIALLWHWNGNWTFPVLWPLLSFPNLLALWVRNFNSIIF